jgi:3-hydroxyisobutyrate dehydrogenase
MQTGYIGLGSMGGALARRLAKTIPLMVYDRSEAACRLLEASGATVAASAHALARDCDIVMICVPRSADVDTILFGPDGIAADLGPGKIVIDQTSGDPSETRQMGEKLANRDVALIDAPVSGGPSGADAGTIAIMVGADDSVYERASPILEAISPNIFRCGALGTGQVMKLVNNTVTMGARFATLEAAAMGVRNGLDLATITDVLNAGGARTKTSENMLPAIVRGEQHAKFALALMLKDLNLANALAIDSGAPLAFGQLTRNTLQVALNEEGEDANLDVIVDLIGRQAGVDLHTNSVKKRK